MRKIVAFSAELDPVSVATRLILEAGTSPFPNRRGSLSGLECRESVERLKLECNEGRRVKGKPDKAAFSTQRAVSDDEYVSNVGSCLGRGGFGRVRPFVRRSDLLASESPTRYAGKKIDVSALLERDTDGQNRSYLLQRLIREIGVQHALSQRIRGIPKIHDVICSQDRSGRSQLVVVMDAIAGLTLEDISDLFAGSSDFVGAGPTDSDQTEPTYREAAVEAVRSVLQAPDLPPGEALRLFKLALIRRVGSVLHQIHALDYLHLDGKPANYMISQDGDPFVLDFGFSRRQSNQPSPEDPVECTIYFCATEQAAKTGLSKTSDTFSLAVSTLYMLYGKTLLARLLDNQDLCLRIRDAYSLSAEESSTDHPVFQCLVLENMTEEDLARALQGFGLSPGSVEYDAFFKALHPASKQRLTVEEFLSSPLLSDPRLANDCDSRMIRLFFSLF